MTVFDNIRKAQYSFGAGDGMTSGEIELRRLTEGFRIRYKRALNNRLRYDHKSFQEQNESFCRDDVKGMLKEIKSNYPKLKLIHFTGNSLEVNGIFQRKVGKTDLFRIKDADAGYCLDFEIVEIKDFKNDYKIAHVKFIIQTNINKQGDGFKCTKFVKECSDIFFNSAFLYLEGTVIGDNQYKVRETRHGKNWREEFVKLKNYQNQKHETLPRLLGFYLRTGWILNGECRNNGSTIMLQSPLAKKMLWEKDPEEFKNKYAYFKDYENEIKKRTRSQKI